MPRLVIRDLCHPSPGLRVIDHPATTTHENCIFAGPGVGRWALGRSRHGGVLPTIWAVGIRPPRRFAAPLRRGELTPRRERTKFPSIGGVAACRRGGKRVRNYPLSPLICYSRARGPRKHEYVCGVVKAGIRSIKLCRGLQINKKNTMLNYSQNQIIINNPSPIPACAGMTKAVWV